jgi:ribosomal protein S8
MKTNVNISKIMNKVLILFIAVFLISFSSCKSKKPAVSIDDEEVVENVNTKVIEAKASLQKIFDNPDMSIEEKEKILNDVKAMNIDDDELNTMIAKAEDVIAKEKEEIKRKSTPEYKLEDYFNKIANAANEDEANTYIDQSLKMFSSKTANVLIIIAEEGHIKDYDKPTNIYKYLNYLKDTKNNVNKVDEIKWDANNKIKTLILRKVK